MFTRATIEEAEEVKQIIQKYERASGQRINLEKTETTFSKNVVERKRKKISESLGVKTVEKHEKYLGLPTIIGKSKKQVFAGIVDRITQKMKDWKDKTLSQAGKEVLIKVVIQAIPSYSMNCFLLPITTCQEIEWETTRFFWGSTIEDRKCHWAGWNILTIPKAKGGIGFRELHWFNLAMLAKQVWNLLQHPESVTFRILKARYFPRGDLMEAESGYIPSFMWRSLMAARELVKEGLAWRIGDGQKVKIAGDRWIGVEEPHSPSEVLLDVVKAGKVEMLIDKDTGKWDEILIGNSFPPSEAKQIIAIPLSANPPEDRQIWRFTKHGFFSVKTAYHLAVSKYSSIHASRSSTSSPPIEWKKIWHIRVIPRVRMFLWKICAEILPTKLNLCKRGCWTDPICVLCGEEQESVDHLFMQCKVVVKLWYVSSLRIDMSHEMHDQFKSFIWHRVASYLKEYVELLAITAWEIWKGRNHACFDNVPFDIQGTINKAYRQWSYLTDTRECCSVSEKPRQLTKRWRKPEQGKYKLNCDVAVLGNGKIGMGFVLRNEQGSVMLAGKGEMKAEGASTLLESMAIRYGMQKVKQYHLRVDTVEGDSKMCMDGLNGISMPDIYCDVTFRDIKELAMEIGCDNFTFVPRDGHAAAQGVNFLSYKQCPHHIKGHIDKDVMI